MQDGAAQARRLLDAHVRLPRTVALVLWGSDNIKSDGGPIAQIEDGDMLRLDAVAGRLETLAENWQVRSPAKPDLSENEMGMGRELFSVFRRTAGAASQGAGVVI